MTHFFHVLAHYSYEVIPAVLIGFLISGIIHEIIPTSLIEKYLGRKGIMPILWATIVGAFLPVCCWGSLPIALSFYKKGSRLGPVLAFLVATPATSVSAIVVSFRLLGFVFTFYMFAVVVIMGIVIGLIGNNLKYTPRKEIKNTCPHCAEETDLCKCGESFIDKVKDVLKFAFIEMPRDIGIELFIGILLAVVVESYVPIGDLINDYLSGNAAYFFSLIVGLFMYFCSTASVPLIHALIGQGMNPGAAFVLLLVGPITSYGTILVFWKEFGVKILFYYILSVCLLAVTFGIIYERIILSL